jgi:hypothetical protein
MPIDPRYEHLAPPGWPPSPKLPPAQPMSLGDILGMVGNSSAEFMGGAAPLEDTRVKAKPPADTGFAPDITAALKALGGQPEATSMNLGSAGLPAQVGAPQMVMPNYAPADAAFAQAKPHPIAAPQYITPHYEASDKLYEQGSPQNRFTEADYQDDKWGRIIQGFAQAALNSDDHRLLSGIIGGLGGYGTALSNKSKMDVETADKMADFAIKRAGYEKDKTENVNQVQNQQSTANYTADRNNQSSMETYYDALGRHEGSKAENIARIRNDNSELQYRANARNSEIAAQRSGAKVIGQNKNAIIVSHVDKDGNLIVDAKPFASFNGVNGNAQGHGAAGVSGIETLINMARANGQLRPLLGEDIYKQVVSPETDYSPTGTYGSLGMLGEKGKGEAYQRAIAEENNMIAGYLMSNPDKLRAMLSTMIGSQ